MIGALALAGATLSAGQEPAEFGARVETVYVDVAVVDGGEPVEGLRAADFSLEDNGVPQRVRLIPDPEASVTVVLAFDVSSSVAGPTLGQLQAAGRELVAGLADETRVALLTFSDALRLEVSPTRDRRLAMAALDSLAPRGETSLWDAIYAAFATTLPTPRRLVVVFTDGADTTSWLEMEQVEAVVSRSEGPLHVVGFDPDRLVVSTRPTGRQGRQPQFVEARESRLGRQLRELVDVTGGSFWDAEDAAGLVGAFRRLARQMEARYVLAYEPTGVERVGEHRLRVRLESRKGRVLARKGYFVPSHP